MVIVMLTPLSENGVRQCYHYWPDEGSSLYHIYEVPPGRPRAVGRGPWQLRAEGPSWADTGPLSLQAPRRFAQPSRQPCPRNSARNGVVSIFKFYESKFGEKAPKKGPHWVVCFQEEAPVDPNSSGPTCTQLPLLSGLCVRSTHSAF